MFKKKKKIKTKKTNDKQFIAIQISYKKRMLNSRVMIKKR